MNAQRLVLLAARLRPDADARQRLRRLTTEPLDWPLVSRLAHLHGVAPLVFHTLTTAAAVPSADQRLAPLRARFLANTANSLVLARELVDLLQMLDDSGVSAMPYKGPVLAAALYGNLALREFSDLDVLVAPADVAATRAALLGRGYEAAIVLSDDQQHAMVHASTAYFMRFDRPGPAGRVTLELHWRIPSTFPIDAPLDARRAYVTVLDRRLPHFSMEDLLLLLSAHGVKHAWNRLKWICDVAELIQRRPGLDWDAALDQATRAGGLRVVLLGCAVAAATLDAELPPRVTEAIAHDRVVPGLAAELRQRVFDRPWLRIGVRNNIRLRERTADKVRYGVDLLSHLITPPAAEQLSRPRWPGARLAHRAWQPFRLAGHLVRKQRRWNRGG